MVIVSGGAPPDDTDIMQVMFQNEPDLRYVSQPALRQWKKLGPFDLKK